MTIVDCNLLCLLVLDTSRRQSKVKFNLKMHGGEITRLGGDFDSILVAILLVASLPGGEMTSYRRDPRLGKYIQNHQMRTLKKSRERKRRS